MKKLIIKIVIVLLGTLCVLGLLDYLSINERTKTLITKVTKSEDYINQGSGIPEIMPIINKVKGTDDTTVLVIGDSIARQIFNGYAAKDDNVCFACTNAAINITGQYMLAKQYLDTHPNATDVWLFMHPLPLVKTFDTDLGYPYGVMPFAEADLIKELDSNTIKQMSSVYGRLFLSGKGAKLIDDSSLNRKIYLSALKKNRKEYKQDNQYEISAQYILKLRELCESRGVTFHFHPCPSTENFREKNEATRSDYVSSELYKVYPDYLDEVYYYPDDWSDDLSHLGKEYANDKYFKIIIKNAYKEMFMDIFKKRENE